MYCNRGSLAVEETILQYSLVGSRFVLQYKLYCAEQEQVCIAIQTVLQYKLYCEVQEQETGLPVSQGRQLCRDTALGARGAQAGAGERRAAGSLGSRRVGEGGRAGGRWVGEQGAGLARVLGERA